MTGSCRPYIDLTSTLAWVQASYQTLNLIGLYSVVLSEVTPSACFPVTLCRSSMVCECESAFIGDEQN